MKVSYTIWVLSEEKHKAKRTWEFLRANYPEDKETIKYYRERIIELERAIKLLKESEVK